VTCALPRTCKKTLQTLPYETSSRSDDKVVIRGVLPLPSLRCIVTKPLSSNKLQHMCIQCNGVTLFLHKGNLTSVLTEDSSFAPAESNIYDKLSTGNRPVYNRDTGSTKGDHVEFHGRLISHFAEVTCPARWPDLAVPGYFLWGYIKSKVYETRPSNADDSQQRVWERMQGNPMEKLRAMIDFPSWLQECNEQHHGHQQSVILKQRNQMNSHRHGTYLPMSKCFPCYLKK